MSGIGGGEPLYQRGKGRSELPAEINYVVDDPGTYTEEQ